ncbi:hypothetical protein RJ640_003171 [Escallonia rubra]|uniref:Uncharacterized protein n=1 Tax=Escallonia rubra TaxID=112253 RepID=A0AA88RE94_9ASTE|nr:hypothetical protein RJ640_003171 [Escallonia rubra]
MEGPVRVQVREAIRLACGVLPLALGSTLHSLVWVLADGIKPMNMGMSEHMRITFKENDTTQGHTDYI